MRIEGYTLVLFIVAYLGLIVSPVSSISFNIVPDERKCVREEVHKDVLVVGDYKLSEVTGQRTDIMVSTLYYPCTQTHILSSKWRTSLQVTDSKGHTLFQKDDAAKGKFAFTTEDYDMFEVCFLSVASRTFRTSLDKLEIRFRFLQ